VVGETAVGKRRVLFLGTVGFFAYV